MGRPHEQFNKKKIKNKKEKKRKEKALKKQARRENDQKNSLDDMIAYVDENGMITSTPPDKEKTEIEPEDIEISVSKKESYESNEDKTRTGVVDYFNDDKGYGFIRDTETRESVFVHIKNVQGEIKRGNRVSFGTEKGRKGLAAINVQIIN